MRALCDSRRWLVVAPATRAEPGPPGVGQQPVTRWVLWGRPKVSSFRKAWLGEVVLSVALVAGYLLLNGS